VRRFRFAAGFDLAAAGLIVGGALLVAASIVAAVVLLAPPRAAPPPAALEPTATPAVGDRTSAALPPGRVATVLSLDVAAGAAGATRNGDHVDVLGYFKGTNSVTRVLLADVPVLSTDRSVNNVALTLAVPQDSALLLQEAQALGAQPFIVVRPVQAQAEAPSSFSDTDLVNRLPAGSR
jgi:hypothetical protein